MTRDLLIHIGLNKAASSTIQAGLTLNKEQLKEAGYFVPETGKPKYEGAGNHNIPWSIIGHERYNPELGSLSDLHIELQMNQYPSTIISSEYFLLLSKEQKVFLKSSFPNHRIYIIIYLRRQDKWFQSLWSELTKMGLSGASFFEYIRPENMQNITSSFHGKNFYNLVANWGEIFCHENMRVRILEKEQLRSAPFFDFLYTCGVQDYSSYQAPKNLNVSPGIKTLEVIRGLAIALHHSEEPVARSKVVAGWVREYASRNKWNMQALNLIDQNTHWQIMNIFEESNRKLAQEYLGQDQLFYEEFIEEDITDFQINDLSPDELFDLISFLLVKSRRQEQKKFYENKHT